MKKDVLIVGYGVVGKNLAKELEVLQPDIYDIKFVDYEDRRKSHYDFCFICVDTPHTKEHPCDITQVKNAIRDNNADIYIIKSTILPGTTDFLSKSMSKSIIFSPEYYGETQHCNNFDFNFTILGGEKEDCLKVQQLLQSVYDARHTFHIVDSRTAELVKYMENSWLATKVSFCVQFFELARNYSVDYETLRELFTLDPRVNPSHTFVYEDSPYWESHCLDKDVLAIVEDNELSTTLKENKENCAQFLKDVIEYNRRCKEKWKI